MEFEAKMEANLKDADVRCKVLQLLMNKKITSFHFSPDLILEAGNSDVWQSLLVEQPHDLHTIAFCNCIDESKSWDVEPFFNSLLHLFPNLQVLRLRNFECNDEVLIKIADHLTKLRSVSHLLCFQFLMSAFCLNFCFKNLGSSNEIDF
jgi:hypothetical protein